MPKFTLTMFSKLAKTKSWVQVLNKNLAVLNLVTLGLILVVGMGYIVQVNRSVTKGYQIRDLETRIEKLQIDNQVMEVKVAENRSMHAIDERVKMLGMVPAETPEYVSAGTPAVALNR